MWCPDADHKDTKVGEKAKLPGAAGSRIMRLTVNFKTEKQEGGDAARRGGGRVEKLGIVE